MARHLIPADEFAPFLLYAIYQSRNDCPRFALFMEHAARYEFAYMMDGEETIGVAMRRAGTIHIGVRRAWRGRWATRSFINDLLLWARDTGEVNTSVAAGNAFSEDFVRRVGFVKGNGGRYELHTQP